MMNVSDFLAMVRKAVELKSLYVMGGFGAPAGYGSNRKRYSTNNPYNEKPERTNKIMAASDDTFFWDCVGLTKGILWGWYGDKSRVYGGADYGTCGIPDYDAKEMMFSGCKDPSKDFSKVDPGEFLWLDGHCGVYLGDGLAAESTPIWKDGVQITAVTNIGTKPGYNQRTWTYHGHLKYVDYSVQPQPVKEGWVKVDGKWYFYKNGQMMKNYWTQYKGDLYYLGADGAMVTGWQTIDENEYYFYPSDGRMARGEWIDGLYINQDGTQTYINKGSWKTNSKGKWWEDESGWYPRNRSVRINKKDYRFDKNGYLIT